MIDTWFGYSKILYQPGYAARTLKPNVSYHHLKYPVCLAKIKLIHYAVRVAHPIWLDAKKIPFLVKQINSSFGVHLKPKKNKQAFEI
jgi:hypothetical protein